MMETGDIIALISLCVVVVGLIVSASIFFSKVKETSIATKITVDNLNITLKEVSHSMTEISKELIGQNKDIESHSRRISVLEEKVNT